MFSRRRGKRTKYAKVILLGGSNVGKTTLIIRWNTGNYEHNTYSTIGAAFTSKNICYGDETIKLNVWDTSGSEKFDSMTKLYYRDALAAILCFDIVDITSLDRAKYWAAQLRENAPGCKIYLCATKVDLLDTDGIYEEITDADCTAFKQAIGARSITKTSSKTGLNIEKLFDNIALDLLTDDGISVKLKSASETVSVSQDGSDNGDCTTCNN